MRSAIPQLDPGESAVIVEAIAHRGEIPYVALIPDPRRYARRVIGLGVNRAVLGADPGPAALGLHAPVICLHAGLFRARADAVGDLVKAVLQRLGTDRDRLEQDVVLWVARHCFSLLPRECP
jgi:hypothetical protein